MLRDERTHQEQHDSTQDLRELPGLLHRVRDRNDLQITFSCYFLNRKRHHTHQADALKSKHSSTTYIEINMHPEMADRGNKIRAQ